MTTISRLLSTALSLSFALSLFGCYDELEDEDQYRTVTIDPNPRAPNRPPGTPSNPPPSNTEPGPGPTDSDPDPTEPEPDPTDPQPSIPTNPLDQLPPECANVPGTLFGVMNKCGGSICHGSPDGPGAYVDLGFSTSDLTTRLINLPGTGACSTHVLIDPDNPEASLLITKLQNPAACGVPMPFAAPPLSSTEIDCIVQWTRAVAELANQ